MSRLKPTTTEEIDAEYEERNRELGIDEVIASMTVEKAEAEYKHLVGVNHDE